MVPHPRLPDVVRSVWSSYEEGVGMVRIEKFVITRVTGDGQNLEVKDEVRQIGLESAKRMLIRSTAG